MIERRCIASGQSKSADELIRFVSGPDRVLVPDLAGKLPGRGCWVSADLACLQKACDKGLFARHIDIVPVVYEALIDQLTALLSARLLQSLALGRRAGLAIGGGGKLASYDVMEGLIIALDASEREAKAHQNRLQPEWVCQLFEAGFLGRAFGRESLAYIGLLADPNGSAGGLTGRIKHDIDRFAPFCAPFGLSGRP